ncbi:MULTISPECIES: hypothetical protein [unclassified Mesorhizobium]|uniref:hypothetical protein n=1 Tax=unclassified Mesorhizobium TaxID=325217 RepID=UPI001FE0C520|nr:MULTISPECIES: hypothetical protein [unclassified Mesorhizobium]
MINSRKNDPDCRAAFQMIRATIEEHCPPGVLMSEDEVNGHYGPELFAEAEALSRAIVLTVQRLSIGDVAKPPAQRGVQPSSPAGINSSSDGDIPALNWLSRNSSTQ